MNAPQRPDAWLEAVNRFPGRDGAEIDRIWENRGVLSADAIARLGIAEDQIGALMIQLLPLARQYAVVPVSGYPVGAVAAGMPDPGTGQCTLYLGANFEFENAATSFTVHAEQAATNNAWLNGEPGIHTLAVSAPPCGYCRQFLHELVTAPQLSVFVPTEPAAILLSTLLPRPFGPGNLGVSGGLMDPRHGSHDLALENVAPSDPVVAAALEAARQSYAPYPIGGLHAYAGAAVQLSDGSIHAGRHAANAAYNPGLSPLASALSFMKLNQPAATTRDISRCVLVEVPTPASQRSATEAALAGCAPSLKLEYYGARIVT